MGKFIKSIVAGVCILSMATWGTPLWAATDEAIGISISVEIGGLTDLTVEFLDTATGSAGTGSLGFDLTGFSVDPASPSVWRVADECLLVSYSSNYSWGLRIVTDNRALINPTDPSSVTLSDYIAGSPYNAGDDGTWGTSDDLLAYSGLVASADLDSGSSDEDPSARASLAWQGYDEWNATNSTYALSTYAPTSTIVSTSEGSSIDDTNLGSCWDPDYDDWHYIGDKSDGGFDDTNPIYQDDDPTTTADESTYIQYPIVAAGLPGSYGSLVPATGGNTTADMPDIENDDGDEYGDLVIFLAARFGSTNWGTTANPADVPFVLEPDTYTASLYVEMVHE